MRAMNFIETEIDRRHEAQGVLVFLGQVRVTAKAGGDTITATLHAKYPKPTNITTTHSDTEEHAVRRSEGHSVVFYEGLQPRRLI